VVFGVKFLRDMIQRDHSYAKVVQAAVDKYAPDALLAITPADEQVQRFLTAGEDPWVTPRFAQDSLRKKLKVVGLSMSLPEVPPAPTPAQN
jgi:ribonucleoside-diphosphate reductase beta chain